MNEQLKITNKIYELKFCALTDKFNIYIISIFELAELLEINNSNFSREERNSQEASVW